MGESTEGRTQQINSRIAKVYPLTPMQEGMLFYYMMNPGTTQYCIQHHIRLERAMDMRCVQEAAHLLSLRHDVLRTAFYFRTAKTPQQIILNGKTTEVNAIDLCALEPAAQDERIKAISTEDVARGFDLEKDSLVRMTFVQTAPERWHMLFSFHHIIMDGWCTGIVLRDFFAYYERLAGGEPAQSVEADALALARETPAYSDYIRWLQKQDRAQAMNYWDTLIGGCDAVGRLVPRAGGYDMPAGAKTVTLSFSKGETERAVAFTKANNVTMSALVESVWALTLQNYTGSRDIVYGRVVSGRGANIRGIDNIVGLFINTVPARANWGVDQSLDDFVKKMNSQIMEGQSYDYCSLAEIQNRSEFGSDMIQSLFVYENFYVDSEAESLISDPRVVMEDAREETNYDISATGYIEDTLGFRIMYDPRKFRADELENVLLSLRQILRAVTDGGIVTPAECETLSARDTLFMLSQNDTWVDFPQDETVVQQFERNAAQYPERTALIFEDVPMSYGELNARANALALRLRSMGVKPDDRVAVLAKRSHELFVAIWGALKAGACYVPVSPSYTLERKRYMIEDSGAKVVLLARAEFECAIDVPMLNVELSETDMTAENPPIMHSPDNLAYVIYTSGTTGNPKGVMLEHRNLMHFMCFCEHRFMPESQVVMPFFTNFCFDLTIHTLFFPLFTGGHVVIFPDDSDVLEAFEQYDKYHYTAVKLTPEHMKMLLAADIRADMGQAVFVTGGELLLADVARKAVENFGGKIKFFNEYGPTECTVGSTCHLFDKEQTASEVTIGAPFDRAQVYMLRDNALVGIDQPGEMCIAGAGVARGYLNREDLNAQKFVPNPFGPGKLYRTGDLARWNGDGHIDYLGRIDEQVKIRGYRIEPGEIAGVLRKIDGVDHAVVVPRVDIKGDKELYAYVVSARTLDMKQLRFMLSKVLPDYMVPAHIAQIDAIPLTANGKLDKRALPDIIEEAQSETYVPPQTDTEKLVADVFAQILSLPRVGRSENFFALGGHSLRATRAINQIEAQSGVRLPLREIFSNPTPEALAKRILTLSGQFSRIPKSPVRDAYPMSNAQKRMYLIMQVSGDTVSYNIPSVHRVRGALDIVRLTNAVQALIDRYEILRTAFLIEDGEAVQRVLPTCKADVKTGVTAAQTDAEIEAELRRFIRPFDLSAPPLMRVEYLKRDDGDGLFLLDLHHIVTDGRANLTIADDLRRLYAGETLPPVELQYHDYSEWMRGRDLSEAADYWKRQFEGDVPVLNLPTDFPRPPVQTYVGHSLFCEIDPQTHALMQALNKAEGTTDYMILMSAFMAFLYKYTAQEDVVVGTPISGRVHRDTEKMLGMFVSTMAVRGYPKGGKIFRSFLHETKDSLLRAFEYQEYPLDSLLEDLKLHRDASRNPLFDVALALQNNEDAAEVSFGGATLEQLTFEQGDSKWDMNLDILPVGDGLRVRMDYRVDLFKPETAQAMLDHFVTLLKRCVAKPGTQINKLSMIEQYELEHVFFDFNNTEHTFDRDESAIRLFERRVEERPDSVALIAADRQITYRELNRMANCLAAKLQKMGVAPESCVAILARRCPEMIVAILATLKAGGAYVPLDPTYPPERLAYVLKDCDAKCLLTAHASLECSVPVLNLLDKKSYLPENRFTPVDVKPDSLAYLIYTSGTTGQPKGVMVEHHNLAHYIDYASHVYVSAPPVVPLFTNYCFDLTVTSVFTPLTMGGTLVLFDEDQSVLDVFRAYGKYRYTLLKLTPAHMRMLAGADVRIPMTSLESIIVGGEALPDGIAWDMLKRFGAHIAIHNEYGPTETTVGCCDYVVRQGAPVNIGKPIWRTQIYVIRNKQVCGVGVPGEICIAGEGVARGYMGRPALTNEAFPRNPFDEGRIYHTGDMAKWQPDGNLVYLGRIDEQVKVRGFRIELGEIESTLMAVPEIANAVAVIKPDRAGDNAIFAYYTTSAPVNAETLRKALHDKLPEYMLPRFMMELPAIPLTRNGKVDRRALPEIDQSNAGNYVAPQTPQECALTQAFAQVFALDRVGSHDDFYELGGDSIKAVRVISALHELGWTIAIKDLVRETLVMNAAPYMREIAPARSAVQRLEPLDKKPVGAASTEQLLSMLEANSQIAIAPPVTYPPNALQALMLQNRDMMCYMHCELETADFAVAERKLLDIVVRQDVLRSAYDPVANAFCLYPPSATFGALWLDLDGSMLSPQECVQAIDRYYLFSSPYSADRRLINTVLLRQDHKISLRLYAHHSVWDAMSEEIMRHALLDTAHIPPDANGYFAMASAARTGDALPRALDIDKLRERLQPDTWVTLDMTTRLSQAQARRVSENFEGFALDAFVALTADETAFTLPYIMLRHGRNAENALQLGMCLSLSMRYFDTAAHRDESGEDGINSLLGELSCIPVMNNTSAYELSRRRSNAERFKVLDEKQPVIQGYVQDEWLTLTISCRRERAESALKLICRLLQ